MPVIDPPIEFMSDETTQQASMTASELEERSLSVAQQLMFNVNRFNKKHPIPQGIKDVSGTAQPVLPDREKLQLSFQTAYCEFIASRMVIVPE